MYLKFIETTDNYDFQLSATKNPSGNTEHIKEWTSLVPVSPEELEALVAPISAYKLPEGQYKRSDGVYRLFQNLRNYEQYAWDKNLHVELPESIKEKCKKHVDDRKRDMYYTELVIDDMDADVLRRGIKIFDQELCANRDYLTAYPSIGLKGLVTRTIGKHHSPSLYLLIKSEVFDPTSRIHSILLSFGIKINNNNDGENWFTK